MKNTLLRSLLTLSVFTTIQLSCTASSIFYKPSITKGDPKALKGKKIKVVFAYDGMMVGEMKEEDYVGGKVREYNAKKPGRGDKWLAEWKSNRSNLFEPAFIKEFNYQGEKIQTSVQTKADSSIYTLVVTTTFAEPGFNLGPIERAARINVICDFRDANGNSIVTIVLNNIASPTMLNDDFETSTRFSECYTRLGKELCKVIKKSQ